MLGYSVTRWLGSALLLSGLSTLGSATLTISSAFQVVEYVPQLVAIQDFEADAQLVNGGVANLARTPDSIDLAGNAETQGLRQFATHKNLRLIYVIAEVAYRLVAKKGSITTPADLEGKRIGTMPGTSAAYFVQRMMASAGVQEGAYTVVSGLPCNQAPCASNSLPEMLKSGNVDAVGFWEPTDQLALDAIGLSNAVIFQNATVYREIYSLYTTAEKLEDTTMRQDIVEFMKKLLQASNKFVTDPDNVIPRVASQVKIDENVLREAWSVHDWKGGLPADLVDTLTEEDIWVAKQDGRSALARADIESFIDRTVLEEAKGDGALL
ncbi:hypothetical protein GGS26DRAFT_563000 [Hypomontagnella submonticulosa]|nr:hypothetical protein GGS26DRAFT_563000 [Hypomontagnella submonticulosa]